MLSRGAVLRAEENSTLPEIKLDDIVVHANQKNSSTSTGLKPNTIIRLDKTGKKYVGDSVNNLIGRVTGIRVKRYGFFADTSEISIRGSTAAQVQFFLDGVPLDSASGEGATLSFLPATCLSRIDVYKSFSPVEFGSSAVGGVVSLKSRPIKPGVHGRTSIGYGSFSTTQALAEISIGKKKSGFTLGIDFGRTRGDFVYFDDNGTPLNMSDDQNVPRQNNHQQLVHAYNRWQYTLDERTRISTALHLIRVDRGVPGLSSFQSQTANKSLTDVLGQIGVERSGYHQGRSRFDDSIYLRFVKSQFSDPDGEIGLGAAQDNDNDTLVIGNRFNWKTDFNKNWQLRMNAEWNFEHFYPEDYLAANPRGTASSRHMLSLAGEPELKIMDGKIIITPQLRGLFAFYDINNDDPSLATRATFFSSSTQKEMSGRLALRYQLPLDLVFKASAGRMIRLPRFSELFGDQGTVLGNAQLSSEKSWNADSSLRWQKNADSFLNEIILEAGGFFTATDDLIQFELTSGLARAGNIGSARIIGLELMASVELGKTVNITSQYTFQNPRDTSAGSSGYLVGRARHEGHTELTAHIKKVEVGTRLHFLDGQYLDRLNTQRIDQRLIWDGTLSYNFLKHYAFRATLQNITNSQIVDAIGFPLPGRSLFVGVDGEY